MAKILVVEDDEFFRKAICDLLTKKNHTISEAPHGKAAVEILSAQDFDMVISDIQMPGMNGIELLEWSLKNKPIPFIIMTGFSTVLETQSAFDLGAKEFISKPFKNVDLYRLIDKVLGVENPLEVVEGGNEYCKISINEFVFGKRLEFDIYVKLSESKYVKIAHNGEEISKERIIHYKERGVRYLYITREGFNYLVGFNLNVAGMLQDKKGISREKKVNFLKYTGEIIMAKAFLAGVDQEVFNEAQTFVELTANTLTDSRVCLDLLSMLNGHSNHIYAHCVGVALYSIMIAQKRGFVSNLAFFKLSMAAMFHDIGKKEIDIALLEKHRSLVTAEEKKILESHVTRGQEILLSLKIVPDDVIQLVYEHHEDVSGRGYPMAKEKNHHPLSKILQLANLFVDLALATPHHDGMTGVDAIRHIEAQYVGRFDRKAMDALKSVFNMDVDEKAA